MKRLLLSLVCLASSFAAFSQANVTSTAISVQGIARNSSNNAVANSSIAVTAELYYINATNQAVSILTRTGTVNTDAFGVFAYVVDIASSDFIKITNSEAWIKISSGGTIFAQEKLMAVPYALHAQNGVPTGTIMAYVGASAPDGWLLCDGRAIPSGDAYSTLKKMLGNGSTDATNVPNLSGIFLRGAGSQTINGISIGGNTLKGAQDQQIGGHTHPQQGTFTTSENWHDHRYWAWKYGNVVRGTLAGQVDPARGAIKADPENPAAGSDDYPLSTDAQAHTHTLTLSGNTANNSGTDNRPVNYGVNYIIKI
jgi:microcystin-dependent protein